MDDIFIFLEDKNMINLNINVNFNKNMYCEFK